MSFGICRGPNGVEGGVHDVPQIDGSPPRGAGDRDDAREIQQVVHEPGLRGGAVHDCGDCTLRACASSSGLSSIGPTQDRVERCAQLV
jgi:hypothetical protein